MNLRWYGYIKISDEQKLTDISFYGEDREIDISPDSSLRFLSVVKTSRIPLFLYAGKPYQVTTKDSGAVAWLTSILLSANGQDDCSAWWQTARTDSPLGILIEVSQPHGPPKPTDALVITDLLLYATRDTHTEEVSVHALPLCSELLNHDALTDPTPPPSPRGTDIEIIPTFLPTGPTSQAKKEDIINLPPVRKRKTVADTFDEATERRKHARKSGGVGIAAAASRAVSSETLPTLQHRRSLSNNPSSLQTRPASRASSVSSTRQSIAREASAPAQSKRSSLAHVQSAPAAPLPSDASSIEVKNKETISKVVMAGMRLHGLVQSKTRKSRSNSTVASESTQLAADLDLERKNDEEYKLLYHQLYKGTCFAFRQHLSSKSLAMHSDAMRETVDKLLGIYCNDPLLSVNADAGDEFTPGGRKLFGSAAAAAMPVAGNPFLVAAAAPGVESKSNTPCGPRGTTMKQEDPT